MTKDLTIDKAYVELINGLKQKVKATQIKAALSANSQMVMLYWEIGQKIIIEQGKHNWGDKVIEKVSHDLSSSFPEMKGFSKRNLIYMRKFAFTFSEPSIVQQVAAQLPWGHNLLLLDKKLTIETYLWYARKVIENGWSRIVLDHQIDIRLYEREGNKDKISNFKETLPPAQSDLAHNILKDPFVFDFLTTGDKAHERDIERELTKHIQKFLLELGQGFAFVGNQYHLDVGDEDYYIDLLFYHLKLRCYVVIELKSGKFKPEYAGKVNFYLSVLDDKLKHETDNPSIGLILCKDKSKITAEYALKDINKPIGLANYITTEIIPEQLKGSLPTIEEIERELSEEDTLE
ncbi:DUF1016 domain-containing protein [Holosporaceae bacterium 'Namur']|nr:DUF1016 domain-containing protein [Holosporaceae bacterium 'Namur']